MTGATVSVTTAVSSKSTKAAAAVSARWFLRTNFLSRYPADGGPPTDHP
jgi:hypothetical protein